MSCNGGTEEVLKSSKTGDTEELQLFIGENREAKSSNHPAIANQSTVPSRQIRWVLIVVYMLFVIFGQSGATLLGRLYYNKGGKNILLATLIDSIGCPLLIPFSLYFSPPKDSDTEKNAPTHSNSHALKLPSLILTIIYFSLGLLREMANMLYSVGLLYLPVSTYSIINATQLAFDAFFCVFLNGQKLTPLIVNSLVLIVLSVTLLVLHTNSEIHTEASKREHSIGFFCTVLASALYSPMLSLTQLSFQKVIKKESFSMVLNMIIYPSLVSTCVVVVALFGTDDWRNLKGEIEMFELGKVMYVIVLVWMGVGWQFFYIGEVGLFFEVSSLFSNIISTMALPIIAILAAVFFRDQMDGPKVIAILLAAWGFASYVYQHYLDDSKSKDDGNNVYEVSDVEKFEFNERGNVMYLLDFEI